MCTALQLVIIITGLAAGLVGAAALMAKHFELNRWEPPE